MTSTEKLQRELQAAQRTIAELQDKLESRETIVDPNNQTVN